jgi:GalNAc-alpha-(1->4)-GalNAc-alpha-(1->3)-diNAcBac-PP-undecaprenol alpha-1,4-N-acetyl-D-galactosaminyltransferase
MKSKKTKKITFFLGSMWRGGAERVISILSREYAEKGWDTDICVLLSNEVAYALDKTTRIIDISGGDTSRIQRLPYWLKAIRNYVKRENPDVIVSFFARINVIVAIACIGLNKKIIVSERNDPKMDGRGIVTNTLTRLIYPRVKTVVFQTERVQKMFSRSVRQNSVVISNPIKITANAENPDENKFVAVGSLKKQKNHRLLIDAFSRVCEKYPEKELYIYGEGLLRETLQKQIKDLGLVSNVHLEGNASDVHNKIKDAYCFVLSSNYEGLSNALLEAMMMGLPCVSTDCAGSDEYIDNEKNGLLVSVNNINELSNAITRFIECRELRDNCGKRAKDVALKIGLDITIKKWGDVIE